MFHYFVHRKFDCVVVLYCVKFFHEKEIHVWQLHHQSNTETTQERTQRKKEEWHWNWYAHYIIFSPRMSKTFYSWFVFKRPFMWCAFLSEASSNLLLFAFWQKKTICKKMMLTVNDNHLIFMTLVGKTNLVTTCIIFIMCQTLDINMYVEYFTIFFTEIWFYDARHFSRYIL